jgi:hypothetical protein
MQAAPARKVKLVAKLHRRRLHAFALLVRLAPPRQWGASSTPPPGPSPGAGSSIIAMARSAGDSCAAPGQQRILDCEISCCARLHVMNLLRRQPFALTCGLVVCLTGLEPGEFILSAYEPGYEMYRERISYGSPISGMTIRLRQPKGVEIRVHERDGGSPVRSVHVVEMTGESAGSELELRLDENGIGMLGLSHPVRPTFLAAITPDDRPCTRILSRSSSLFSIPARGN